MKPIFIILTFFFTGLANAQFKIKLKNGKIIDFNKKEMQKKYFIAHGAEGGVFKDPFDKNSVYKIFVKENSYFQELEDIEYLRSKSHLPIQRILDHGPATKRTKAWIKKQLLETTLFDECKARKITNPTAVNNLLRSIVAFSTANKDGKVIVDWKASNIMRSKTGKWFLVDYNLEDISNFSCDEAFSAFFFGACMGLVRNPCK